MRKVPMRLLIPLYALLGLPACVGAPALLASPSACAALLPQEWREPLPDADLANGGATVGDWIAFGDAQTAQLGKANDRTVSAIGIVERCEERDAAAVKKSRPKFLGVF